MSKKQKKEKRSPAETILSTPKLGQKYLGTEVFVERCGTHPRTVRRTLRSLVKARKLKAAKVGAAMFFTLPSNKGTPPEAAKKEGSKPKKAKKEKPKKRVRTKKVTETKKGKGKNGPVTITKRVPVEKADKKKAGSKKKVKPAAGPRSPVGAPDAEADLKSAAAATTAGDTPAAATAMLQ